MTFPLTIRAGHQALQILRRDGLSPNMIRVIAGASGGAKWLALNRMDRVILRRLVPNVTGPVHLIGSSIGAWRMTYYARRDPLAALQAFENTYLAYLPGAKDDRIKVTRDSWEFVQPLLGSAQGADIFENPNVRLNIMAVRAKGPLASENRAVMVPPLVASGLINALSRRSLGLWYERALFHDPRAKSAFASLKGFPQQSIPLSTENIGHALMASGSIPLVTEGIGDIPGAVAGIYRDGGIIDYHFDVAFPIAPDDPDGLVLYPHFIDRVIPGWFDKKLAWRKASRENMARVVLISPSPEFVSSLPGGKIPDRYDFSRYDNESRLKIWRGVLDETERLADALESLIEKNNWAEHVKPLG